MKVEKRIIQYALAVLDNQFLHCHDNITDKEQRAYYDGMYEMLELILTSGYENLSFGIQHTNKHYVPALDIMR